MKTDINNKARRILDAYLEANGHRKTTERYTILNAACHINGHFSLEDLSDAITVAGMKVSRATLYNTMRLFARLQLVVRHRLTDGTKYEMNLGDDCHCHQVCTLCGAVSEVRIPEVSRVLEAATFNNFRQDGFTLYLYGVCSECQNRLERTKKSEKKRKLVKGKTI